jgi:hypothetical protein
LSLCPPYTEAILGRFLTTKDKTLQKLLEEITGEFFKTLEDISWIRNKIIIHKGKDR